MIGTLFGNYRVVETIGAGGMGEVYKATHTLLGKPAALKMLLPKFSDDREIVARFFNEAKAASGIDDPGIVTVLDFGYTEEGNAYILMEYLSGESLQDRMDRIPVMPPADALRLLRQVARSLSAAHAQGIVHRDLKPENLFIVPDQEVEGGERCKILDFGIAKLSEDHDGSPVKTQAGEVLGTPKYMSPEQCKGADDIDGRSDLYSLGCILFEMVTGEAPFAATGKAEMMGQHMFLPAPAATELQPRLSAELSAFISALLAKERSRRPGSADEMAARIDRLLAAGSLDGARASGSARSTGSGERGDQTAIALQTTLNVDAPARSRPRRARWLLALAAIVLVGGVAGFWFTQRQQTGTTASAAPPPGDRARRASPEVAPKVTDDRPPHASTTGATQTGETAASMRAYTIRSLPAGAQVHREGQLLAQATPYQVSLPAGESRVFQLRHDGYQPTEVTVPGPDTTDQGEVLVSLRALEEVEPRRASKKRKKTRSSRRKTKKSPTKTGSSTSGEVPLKTGWSPGAQ